jgi:Flp pilus assembly protein TadD
MGGRFALAAVVLIGLAALAYRVEHPSIVVHEERRSMNEGMGNMAEVSALMERLQANPEDEDAMRHLGMLFMQMGAWVRAMNFWDMVLAKAPKDLEALNQKGVCLFQLGRHPEAAEVFSRMVEVDAQNPHAHYNLGVLYAYYLNATDTARRHFEAVVHGPDPRLAAQAKEDLAALGAENALTPQSR